MVEISKYDLFSLITGKMPNPQSAIHQFIGRDGSGHGGGWLCKTCNWHEPIGTGSWEPMTKHLMEHPGLVTIIFLTVP